MKKSKPGKTVDIAEELTVEGLMAHATDPEAERLARADSERDNARAPRPPVAVRPSNPVHWGYPYSFDVALPADERAALIAFFERFTTVAHSRSGFFIVGPRTGPEARRAAWDGGGTVLEVDQLRAQLPPDDLAARRERLAAVLAHPGPEAWFEVAMLLSTWDAATLPAAIAEAERGLERWPDELRTMIDPWRDRPELRALVRVHWGELHGDDDIGHITTIRGQDAGGLESQQQRLSHVTALDMSGEPDLPERVLRCTALTRLERLLLQQATHGAGSAKLSLGRLLAAPHLQGLRALSLDGYKLAAADLKALAASSQPLEHLRIQYAKLKPTAAKALAELASHRRLRTLDLKYNDLGPQGAGTLFSRPDDWRSLRVLDISANEIGDEGVEALAAASLDELRWLNISSNDPKQQLTAASAHALASAASLGRLETLILFGHPIGSEGVAALLRSPQLRALRQLNVGATGTNLAELVAHFGTAEPVALTALNLGCIDASTTPLDLRDARFLRSVRTLSLEYLAGKEYAAVLSCPHLQSLEALALGGSYSDADQAFEALASIRPPPSLHYLDLTGWKPTPEQAATLAASPLGRQLWGLRMMSGDVTPDAWHAFYQAGLPLVGLSLFDATAPEQYTTSTTLREEL